jgi:hypothetical protein
MLYPLSYGGQGMVWRRSIYPFLLPQTTSPGHKVAYVAVETLIVSRIRETIVCTPRQQAAENV